jgi:hypothetical protein
LNFKLLLATLSNLLALRTHFRRHYAENYFIDMGEHVKNKADKAYMEEMNLSAGQFINLKWIETVANKQGANIDVMVGPAESMWNIRRN